MKNKEKTTLKGNLRRNANLYGAGFPQSNFGAQSKFSAWSKYRGIEK